MHKAHERKSTLRVVERSDDGVLVGRDWPLIPDAEYIVRVTHWETQYLFRSARLFLHIEIVSGQHTGVRLFAAFNLAGIVGKPGRGGRFKAARRSKLVQTLARLTGQRIRGDRLSLDWLTRSLLRVRTRTVTHDSEQRELPEVLCYSVVDGLVTIEAGGQ